MQGRPGSEWSLALPVCGLVLHTVDVSGTALVLPGWPCLVSMALSERDYCHSYFQMRTARLQGHTQAKSRGVLEPNCVGLEGLSTPWLCQAGRSQGEQCHRGGSS